MRNILIIIPTYNEADNIRPLVSAINAVFRTSRKYRVDLLFMDDSSPDGTADVIRSMQTENEHIYCLSGPKQGLGKAYLRGFAHIESMKRPYFGIVMMDADLSHRPGDIPRLLSALEDGTDYVIGSRYISGGRSAGEYSHYRQLQSAIANRLARLFVGLPTPVKDLTGGFKAIRYAALRGVPLNAITASGYVFQVSLYFEFAQRGYNIQEVPITFDKRLHGTSKLGMHDIGEFLRAVYSLNPYSGVRRLIRFGLVGALGSIINVGLLISLVHLGKLNISLAYLIALEVSIISNFLFNHWFTFNAGEQEGRSSGMLSKLVRYNVVGLGGVVIAWTVFSVLTGLGLHYVAADILGIVAATSWNYWLSVRLVWPIVDTAPQEQASLQYEFREE